MLHLHEIVLPGLGNALYRHLRRTVVVVRAVYYVVDYVSGVAGVEPYSEPPVEVAHQVVEDLHPEVYPVGGAHPPEYLLVLLLGGVVYLYLVPYPPQKGLVHEPPRLYIRGENDELVKGYLELHSRVEREEVLAPLQRHYPPVKEVLGGYLLAAGVGHDEDPVVGLHLEGGLVKLGHGVEVEVQHLYRQLPAGHYH